MYIHPWESQETCDAAITRAEIDVYASICEGRVPECQEAEKDRYTPPVCLRQSSQSRPGGHAVLRCRAPPERPSRDTVHPVTGSDSFPRDLSETTGRIAGDRQHHSYQNAGSAALERLVAFGGGNRQT